MLLTILVSGCHNKVFIEVQSIITQDLKLSQTLYKIYTRKLDGVLVTY